MSRFSEPMTATKSMRYNTRHLVAGEGFMAAGKDVRVLEAIGKARRGRPAAELSPMPASLARTVRPARAATAEPHPLDHDGKNGPGGSTKQTAEDIAAVRAEYTEKVGRRPFPGWDADELRRRMAAV